VKALQRKLVTTIIVICR